MPKGEHRSNKEKRKPKQKKPAASAPSASSGNYTPKIGGSSSDSKSGRGDKR